MTHGYAMMLTFSLPFPQSTLQSSIEKHWAEDVTLFDSTLNIKRPSPMKSKSPSIKECKAVEHVAPAMLGITGYAQPGQKPWSNPSLQTKFRNSIQFEKQPWNDIAPGMVLSIGLWRLLLMVIGCGCNWILYDFVFFILYNTWSGKILHFVCLRPTAGCLRASKCWLLTWRYLTLLKFAGAYESAAHGYKHSYSMWTHPTYHEEGFDENVSRVHVLHYGRYTNDQ